MLGMPRPPGSMHCCVHAFGVVNGQTDRPEGLPVATLGVAGPPPPSRVGLMGGEGNSSRTGTSSSDR